MGELEKQLNGFRYRLPARSIVGRAETADLVLEDGRASGEHASLYFDEGFWVVRDLASRNGTQVNGMPMPAGSRKALELGDVLTFGSEIESYKLIDDEPPEEAAIFPTVQATFDLEDLALEFKARPGGTFELALLSGPLRIEAPHRAFHDLLLLLAKARLAPDPSNDDESGWVSLQDLVPALYPDTETLNVNLYRARRQFVELGVRDARNLIERKPGAKMLRIGVSALTVLE